MRNICESKIDLHLETTLSSTIVRTSSFQSLKLSSNDCIIPSAATISFICFYDIHQWSHHNEYANDLFMNVERIIFSLKQLLEYYPVLTGVLKVSNIDEQLYSKHDDDNGGIHFVSTSTNIGLRDIPLSMIDCDNAIILPPTLQLINDVDSTILFHIRHTRFLCGSVALGICFNHQLADAHSLFQLVNDWTQLYRNSDYEPNVCHQRSLLEPTKAVSLLDKIYQQLVNQ
jgi:hypothetical protein